MKEGKEIEGIEKLKNGENKMDWKGLEVGSKSKIGEKNGGKKEELIKKKG